MRRIKVLDVKFILCKFQVIWFYIKNIWVQFVPVGLQFQDFWSTKQPFDQSKEKTIEKQREILLKNQKNWKSWKSCFMIQNHALQTCFALLSQLYTHPKKFLVIKRDFQDFQFFVFSIGFPFVFLLFSQWIGQKAVW